MNITLDLYQLKNLIKEMAELGAAEYAKTVAPKSDAISQNQAYKKYGEAAVKNWLKNNLIDFKRIGVGGKTSTKMFSRAELLSAYKTENLIKNKYINNQK